MNNVFSILVFLFSVMAAILAHDHHDHHHHHHHHHMVPHYHYAYGVHDPHTKDHKHQEEHRHHDDVHGEYSLDSPDGTHRVVKYTSDHHDGFGAEVHREGHAHHPGHHGHGHGGTSYVHDPHWGRGSGK